MGKYLCSLCGYMYDPEEADGDGVTTPAKGTAFERLPAEWACPICGSGKDGFQAQGDISLCNRWN
jgi:rubredoxin